MFLLYHDEDALEHAVIRALRSRGVDCLAADKAGRRGLADEDQLKFATAAGRVLYTKNTADFVALHGRSAAEQRTHGGLIVLTDQRSPVGLQLRALSSLLEGRNSEEMRGRLVYLLNWA